MALFNVLRIGLAVVELTVICFMVLNLVKNLRGYLQIKALDWLGLPSVIAMVVSLDLTVAALLENGTLRKFSCVFSLRATEMFCS